MGRGQATSGAEALWGRETMAGMSHGGVAQGNSLDAEVGYGVPVGSRLVSMPKLGLRTSEHGKDYRLGYSLGVLSRESRLPLDQVHGTPQDEPSINRDRIAQALRIMAGVVTLVAAHTGILRSGSPASAPR